MNEIENAVSEVSEATPEVATATPVVLTKAEKLARIDEQIAKLQTKRYNIENDIVTVSAPKEVKLPEAGADVLFSYGRKTATTDPLQLVGKVVAIRPASVGEAGKKLPAQVKVSVGEGFEQEFYVIYPAQIIDQGAAE